MRGPSERRPTEAPCAEVKLRCVRSVISQIAPQFARQILDYRKDSGQRIDLRNAAVSAVEPGAEIRTVLKRETISDPVRSKVRLRNLPHLDT